MTDISAEKRYNNLKAAYAHRDRVLGEALTGCAWTWCVFERMQVDGGLWYDAEVSNKQPYGGRLTIGPQRSINLLREEALATERRVSNA
jgi:hypothetical protein